jgi:hypothetical protein
MSWIWYIVGIEALLVAGVGVTTFFLIKEIKKKKNKENIS